ncbi:uncharacterized protein K444DRAFT_628545 [Hyaloscypha bicolor E]|uniref:DUF3752 domain-containing protein n=1 Tax=Hyaloscypha bicolor E TaxID=1095630 RepID=A0A2J6TEU5_9HELO|nr:uncharacterized protein K444DRAFT_628545 [Hyaloscypha bicolor E]PMD61519.1 hypothetical protein K444DRAFT_628545 [Hyaloscypha bicolor E]
MPVGPELPPHLVKRKRSIDDDEHPNSPPHKVQAATAPRTLGPTLPPSKNPDELDVDDSSKSDYGPSVPATKFTRPASPPKRVLGPTPPSQAKNPEELDIEASSEDDYGPFLQPTSGPPKPTSKPSPAPKRILGPAPPPAPLTERPPNPPDSNSNSDSDSDDDYGPSLPPPAGSAAEASLFATQQQERLEAAATTASAKPQRAEWMLVPPTDSDWTSRVDPTKLKNRKFQSGKGAKAPTEKSGISAIWTETPEQKRQRLADEVLGRAEVATSSRTKKERPEGESREDEATSRRIREYNEKMRGKSLYEERRERKENDGTKEEEDDPSKRGFDREKDMALGGRMGHGEKREMLAKAKDFGSRFQKGSFL